MLPTIAEVVADLESFAPRKIAEDWDNVGLLLGDPDRPANGVMTCLTLTPDVAEEAIQREAKLIVAHHPILFRAVKRITTETVDGKMLLDLIENKVAVYSPHTAFDNAEKGINPWLAGKLGLQQIEPLRPDLERVELPGSGRWGRLPSSLTWDQFRSLIKERLGLDQFQFVTPRHEVIDGVGIACGSAAEFLNDANRTGCQVFITGEARFHSCLEARSLGIGLVLLGHYASERPAVEMLADRLQKEFADLEVWASQSESDPIQWEAAPATPPR